MGRFHKDTDHSEASWLLAPVSPSEDEARPPAGGRQAGHAGTNPNTHLLPWEDWGDPRGGGGAPSPRTGPRARGRLGSWGSSLHTPPCGQQAAIWSVWGLQASQPLSQGLKKLCSPPSNQCVNVFIKTLTEGMSLVVQQLKFSAPRARGLGLHPAQGTRPHTPQLRVHTLQQTNR